MSKKKKILEQMKRLHDAAAAQETAIQTAFVFAIDELRNNVSEEELASVVSGANKELIIDTMKIDQLNDLLYGIGIHPTGYIFSEQLINTFALGASAAIANLPPELQKIIGFDFLGERAVNVMRSTGATVIQEVTEATKQGVRTALEDNLLMGHENPNVVARNLRRLLGLTQDQMKGVLNFKAQLQTRSLLGFTPPEERRLNAIEQAIVRRHMKEGHLNQTQINNLVETYYQRLVNKRALDIARTESLNAVNNAQQELWEQGLDQGLFNENTERKFWITARDDRVRMTHAVIPSMNPYGVKIRSMFATPYGAVEGPGTSNKGFINCRCVVVLGEMGQTYTQEGYLQ